MKRSAAVERKTTETEISLALELDGTGQYELDTGVEFFDHMLSHVAKHGLFDLKVQARGDIGVDFHHVVEDVGIVLGQALREALGDKRGINRYGTAFCPMDEALVQISLDLSGRCFLAYDLRIGRPKVGQFDTELTREFFQALARSGEITLHVRQLAGENAHHIIEAAFKALGKALDQATMLDPRQTDLPSTKGSL